MKSTLHHKVQTASCQYPDLRSLRSRRRVRSRGQTSLSQGAAFAPRGQSGLSPVSRVSRASRYRNPWNLPIILICPERSIVFRSSRRLPLFRLLLQTGPLVHRASRGRKHPPKLQPADLRSFEFS